jgi:hypothetical protein
MTFMVYWLEGNQPQAQRFDAHEMTKAMTFMEVLRKIQRAGTDISFVTFCSENPNSVGHPGVAEVGPDYNWKKRRD